MWKGKHKLKEDVARERWYRCHHAIGQETLTQHIGQFVLFQFPSASQISSPCARGFHSILIALKNADRDSLSDNIGEYSVYVCL